MKPRDVAILQGAYYLGTGLWPILHIKSFEKVTGPKTDDWLVKTVGILVAVTGGLLLRGAARREIPPPLSSLAVADAIALGAVSAIYGSCGRISKIYLLDSVAEAALALLWLGRHGARQLSASRFQALG